MAGGMKFKKMKGAIKSFDSNGSLNSMQRSTENVFTARASFYNEATNPHILESY